MNLQEKIAKLIDSDLDYRERYDISIKSKYENANNITKELIDEIFTDLCGYRLGTVLANEDKGLLIDLGLE